MKRFTPPFLLLLLPLFALVPMSKGVITNNVPISQMVITTNVEDNAYFPLIQPYPGRTTNDNFRATTASIFNGRGSGSFTNLTINNLTVVSNLFLTNVTVQEFSTTNIFNDTVTYITNSFLVISNTTVTINGTNVATINPTVGRLPYNGDGTNFFDSPLFRIDDNTVGANEVDAGLVAITNLANNTYLVTRTIGGIDGVITNGPAIGSFELWTNSAGYLQPFDLTQPLFWTNSVTWGPGTTNVLARIDNTLLYMASDQSGSIYPYIGVTNLSEANMALFGSGGRLAVIRGSSGVSLFDDIASGNDVRWAGHYWAPPSDTHAQLGGDMNSTEQPWYQVNAWTNTIYGFRSDTNYSRLAISHTGTNGAIVFSSQTNGTVGVASPFNFIGSDVRQAGINPGMPPNNNGFISMPNESGMFYTNIVLTGLSAGNNSLFTVPANMRFALKTIMATAANSGTTGHAAKLTNAVVFSIGSNSSVSTNSTPVGDNSYVFYGGESVELVNSDTVNRAEVIGVVFTNTIPLISYCLNNLSAGDNVIYTVPDGKHPTAPTGSISATYINTSGGARIIKWYRVLSGGSVGASSLISTQSVPDGTNGQQTFNNMAMFPGDSIVINVDAGTATQHAWITVYELD